MRCQSPSCCVVCSSAISKARGEWLYDVFDRAIHEMDMSVSMLTLTVRHKKGDDLKTLLSAMEQAYTNISSTHAFKELRNEYRAKFIRVLEVTYGKNGFHPHFHIAIIHDKGTPLTTYRAELEDTWIRFLVKQGLEAPKAEIAVDIVENASNEQRAWYLTKANGLSSLEFTARDSKEAKNGNLGIWQVHANAVDGDKASRSIWQEYEKAIKGKRIISPSRGMADFFGIYWKKDQEIEVDTILSQFSDADKLQRVKQNEPLLFVGAITPVVWTALKKKRLLTEFRSVIKYGPEALQDWLILHDINYRLVTREDINAGKLLNGVNLPVTNMRYEQLPNTELSSLQIDISNMLSCNI